MVNQEIATGQLSLYPGKGGGSAGHAFGVVFLSLSCEPRAFRKKNIQRLIDAGIDWDVLTREARRERVLPQVCQQVISLAEEWIPISIRKQIEEFQRNAALYSMVLTKELERLVRCFADHELPALALKGPVLAHLAYGDVALRSYGDLDVFIPRKRFDDAELLVKKLGYKCEGARSELDGWRKKAAIHLEGQFPFRRGRLYGLDMHTRLLPAGYSIRSDFDAFWRRSRKVELRETAIRACSLEDLIMILSYQGIKNQWNKLKYVSDIAAVLSAQYEIDWDACLSRAEECAGASALKMGLLMANRLLRGPLPDRILAWIGSDPRVDHLVTTYAAHLRNEGEPHPPNWSERIKLQFGTKDTVAEKARYATYSLLQHVWSTLIKP